MMISTDDRRRRYEQARKRGGPADFGKPQYNIGSTTEKQVTPARDQRQALADPLAAQRFHHLVQPPEVQPGNRRSECEAAGRLPAAPGQRRRRASESQNRRSACECA